MTEFSREAIKQATEEYLKRGGKITVLEPAPSLHPDDLAPSNAVYRRLHTHNAKQVQP